MQASPVSSKRLSSSLRGFNTQLHYDNPMRKSGRTDKSAFRLYYTTVPRENVLGVFSPLIVSVEPVMRLKPGTHSARPGPYGFSESTVYKVNATRHDIRSAIRGSPALTLGPYGILPVAHPVMCWWQVSSTSSSRVAARCRASPHPSTSTRSGTMRSTSLRHRSPPSGGPTHAHRRLLPGSSVPSGGWRAVRPPMWVV